MLEFGRPQTQSASGSRAMREAMSRSSVQPARFITAGGSAAAVTVLNRPHRRELGRDGPVGRGRRRDRRYGTHEKTTSSSA